VGRNPLGENCQWEGGTRDPRPGGSLIRKKKNGLQLLPLERNPAWLKKEEGFAGDVTKTEDHGSPERKIVHRGKKRRRHKLLIRKCKYGQRWVFVISSRAFRKAKKGLSQGRANRRMKAAVVSTNSRVTIEEGITTVKDNFRETGGEGGGGKKRLEIGQRSQRAIPEAARRAKQEGVLFYLTTELIALRKSHKPWEGAKILENRSGLTRRRSRTF